MEPPRSFSEKVLGHVRLVRLRWVIPVVLILFAATDAAVLRLERVPGLILRNEGRSHFAERYMFRQMHFTKDRPVVAFFGASVIQGYINTTPETAAPVVTERVLFDRGIKTRCFNLACLGNNLGDHLALGTEAARNGADLLVIPLHFKLFSNLGTLGFMSFYREDVTYLRRRPDFLRLRRRLLKVSDREYQEIRLKQFFVRHWAYYRERRLVSHVLTGNAFPIPVQVQQWLLTLGGVEMSDSDTPLGKFNNPEERNRDNLWKLQPRSYHDNQIDTYRQISVDPRGRHFQVLRLVNGLSGRSDAKILFYMIPLNRTAINRFGYFKWEQHAAFKRLTEEMALRAGNHFVDLTDAVDDRYFTDGDHLNINGHAKLAEALAGPIADILQGEGQ